MTEIPGTDKLTDVVMEYEEWHGYPNVLIVNDKALRKLERDAADCVPYAGKGITVGGLRLMGSAEVEPKTCYPAYVEGR